MWLKVKIAASSELPDEEQAGSGHDCDSPQSG
jgi:hypothetical protein